MGGFAPTRVSVFARTHDSVRGRTSWYSVRRRNRKTESMLRKLLPSPKWMPNPSPYSIMIENQKGASQRGRGNHGYSRETRQYCYGLREGQFWRVSRKGRYCSTAGQGLHRYSSRGRSQYRRALRGRHVAMLCGQGEIVAVRGGKGEPRRRRASILPRPAERSIWPRVSRQCLRFFRNFSGRSIFRSALLNLPQTGSSYLPASYTFASPDTWVAGLRTQFAARAAATGKKRAGLGGVAGSLTPGRSGH